MTSHPRQVFHRLPKGPQGPRARSVGMRATVLAPAYWGLAHLVDTPGLDLQAKATRLVLRAALGRRRELGYPLLRQMLLAPMESFRYFELAFAWQELGDLASFRYLDVSSPRLLPLLLLQARPSLSATLLNPDARDLGLTRRLAEAAGLGPRCQWCEATLAAARFEPASFDVLTSISVLEHIPDDTEALRAMWSLLAPGGRLVLTVPCAASAFDEFIDWNEYGLLTADADGFVFGQRFYDEDLLAKRVLSVTGTPTRQEVFGEKVEGTFFTARNRRLEDPNFPHWREPFATGVEYRRFAAISSLPGIGVVAMSFRKP